MGGGGKEPAWIYQQLELLSFRQDRKARRKRLALTLVGIRWDDCEYLFLAKVELLFFFLDRTVNTSSILKLIVCD